MSEEKTEEKQNWFWRLLRNQRFIALLQAGLVPSSIGIYSNLDFQSIKKDVSSLLDWQESTNKKLNTIIAAQDAQTVTNAEFKKTQEEVLILKEQIKQIQTRLNIDDLKKIEVVKPNP